MDTTTLASAADTLQSVATVAGKWSLTGLDSIYAGDGITISIVGIIVVFTSLTLLTFLIRGVSQYARMTKDKLKQEEATTVTEGTAKAKTINGFSGELVAAISLALHEFLYEQHDEEKTIITIHKISKPYSPWSSKLYNMTRPPHHSIKRG